MADKIWSDEEWQDTFGIQPNPYNTMYAWLPRPDITVYELALCLPVLTMGYSETGNRRRAADYIEALPDEARRHWRKAGDEHG